MISPGTNDPYFNLVFWIPTSKRIYYVDSFPCILHWNKDQFVVLKKVTTGIFSKKLTFHIADPAHGHIKLSLEKFKEAWIRESDSGVALLLTPTEEFYKASNTIEIIL